MKFIEDIARRKLGAPPEWTWCKSERIGTDAFMLEGGIPRKLKSGPRKGRNTFKDCELAKVVVTDAEVKAEKAAYEASTGLCCECRGEKVTTARWSTTEGRETRECRRCKGSGTAPFKESHP